MNTPSTQPLLETKTLTVSIRRAPRDVYAFAANLENLPLWAKAFCRSIKNEGGRWTVETPDGPMNIRMSAPNAFGILDHWVVLAPGVEICVPMRVIPNGGGSEVLFTLFRYPDMSKEKFAEDIGMVEKDLAALKSVLE